MNSYGVVLRKLRAINKEQMKVAAKRVGRSVGWLCEVENQTGRARINEVEFRRIVSLYGGDKYNDKEFALWTANAAKAKPKQDEISFDGAILKYLRLKKQMTLKKACDSPNLKFTIKISNFAVLQNNLNCFKMRNAWDFTTYF